MSAAGYHFGYHMVSALRISDASTIETSCASHAMPAAGMVHNRSCWRRAGQAAAAAGLLGLSLAHGALIDRGGGLIYDDIADVTWLEDAAAMTTAMPSFLGAWNIADAFVFQDSVRIALLSDWRLPSRAEFESLWDQGVRGGSSSHPFRNLVAGPYWGWDWRYPIATGGTYSGNWDFGIGGWAAINDSYHMSAMPVLDGDVGPAPAPAVPSPPTVVLVLCGLAMSVRVRPALTRHAH